ncbi:MAG: translation elongation factor Ts [Bacteroidia bacterium]|nr:translation elongation factor Ts [Bacteroidia bacterium]MDW8346154.1 translation elongation factor Ts [Bacteroidia bacterium]
MQITTAEVNKLRQQTGAGVMDCKKALEEAQGDFEKAIEILRKKGQKISANRQDREAKEGLVVCAVSEDNKTAAAVELNCETDFVARNEEFASFAQKVVQVVLKEKIDNPDNLTHKLIDGKKISDHLLDLMAKIGEKITISKSTYLASNGIVVSYTHPGSRLAVLVALEGSQKEGVHEVGKSIAMQIAALNPVSIDEKSVPQEIIERELEIGRELARQEGKPENMIEKIAQGKLQKFYKEATLLHQEFVRDNSKTVQKYLQEFDPNLKVVAFKRIQLGAK